MSGVFFNTRNAQEKKREKSSTYSQHFSHVIREQRGKEQFLEHVKAMKTPVLSYRLKFFLTSPGCIIYFKGEHIKSLLVFIVIMIIRQGQ